MLARILVFSIFLLIVASLFSALLFLYKGGGKGERVVRSLTLRIGLSIALFALLMAGYYLDVLVPHGLNR